MWTRIVSSIVKGLEIIFIFKLLKKYESCYTFFPTLYTVFSNTAYKIRSKKVDHKYRIKKTDN